jgi:solute carrier family 27 (fatty acid transporter), member 1/4
LLNRILNVIPNAVIKIDENFNPVRDENGYCIRCESGEPGLLIGLIGKKAREAYSGYANNNKESKTKIIDNVFKTGQKAFNSGDLMVVDTFGYVYFRDRIGDTFRWRGENVATIEVENVISSNLNSTEVAVYGVEIPGQEGRAGMAAICDNDNKSEDVDMDKLANILIENLPPYARPVFIRRIKALEHTGIISYIQMNLK